MFNNKISKASLYSMEGVNKKLNQKNNGKELFTSFGDMDNSADPKNFSFGESDKEDDSINNVKSSQKKSHYIFGNKMKNNINTRSDQHFSFEYSKNKITKQIKEYIPKNINSAFEIYTISQNELNDFKKFLFEKYPGFYTKKKK